MVFPRDFSELALWLCSIPYWQGTDFTGVMPGARAPVSRSPQQTLLHSHPELVQLRADILSITMARFTLGIGTGIRTLPHSPYPYPSSAVHSLPSCFSLCCMLREAQGSLALADFDLALPVLLHSHQKPANHSRCFSMTCHIRLRTMDFASCWAATASVAGQGENHSGYHGCYAICLHTAFIFSGPCPIGYIYAKLHLEPTGVFSIERGVFP